MMGKPDSEDLYDFFVVVRCNRNDLQLTEKRFAAKHFKEKAEMHGPTAGEWRKALVFVVLSLAPTAICKGGGGGTGGAGAVAAGSSRASTR
jgi:hypothetical protein